MRTLLCLIFALTTLSCTPDKADAPTKAAEESAELNAAEKEAKKALEAKLAAEAKEREAAAKKASEAAEAEAKRKASWVRPPVKKVPAPKDVRQPPKKGATSTMAGVKYRVLKSGEGKGNPKLSSQVTIHYTGWTTNGRMFDSTLKTGEPATFGLSGLIDGWKDVIQYMVIGDVFRVWIPQKLAYKGKPGRPAGTLVFDIELLDFK